MSLNRRVNLVLTATEKPDEKIHEVMFNFDWKIFEKKIICTNVNLVLNQTDTYIEQLYMFMFIGYQ